MQEREILDHAKQAIDAIAPDCFEHIWEKSSTVDPMQYPLPDPPNAVFHKKSQVKRNLILSISILAACLLCVFGLRWRGQVTVYTTINLDVNPSISICLNHSGDILSVTGLNEDGKKIVAKLSNIKEQKLDQIIAATIKQMVTDGYFTSEDENAVLISVDTNNSEEATALMDQISSQISTEMDQQALSGNIISQQMDDDADVKKLAKDLHISSGKATFIQSMTHENQKLSKKDLADMKISEIVATAKTEGMDVTKFQHPMKIKNVPPPKEDNRPHKDTTEVHASPTEEEAISHKPQENRKQTVVETSDKETPSIAVTHRPSDRQQQSLATPFKTKNAGATAVPRRTTAPRQPDNNIPAHPEQQDTRPILRTTAQPKRDNVQQATEAPNSDSNPRRTAPSHQEEPLHPVPTFAITNPRHWDDDFSDRHGRHSMVSMIPVPQPTFRPRHP